MPNCPYCSKPFGRISSLQRHSVFCSIQHEGAYAARNSMEDMDVPPIRDMYIVIQKLMLDNKLLLEKVNKLEKISIRERKKMCLIDWLNERDQPPIDFSEWTKNIVVTQTDFNRILNVSIIEIIMDIIISHKNDNIPIRGFDQKLKTLFIYIDETWRIVERIEFYRFVDNIVRKLTYQLNNWVQANNLQDGNNDEKFHKYTKKIYSIDCEEVSRRVHLRLYNNIKYNLKKVVEYEFSF